jgi:hypothetical protein
MIFKVLLSTSSVLADFKGPSPFGHLYSFLDGAWFNRNPIVQNDVLAMLFDIVIWTVPKKKLIIPGLPATEET